VFRRVGRVQLDIAAEHGGRDLFGRAMYASMEFLEHAVQALSDHPYAAGCAEQYFGPVA
jgi:hypothetical protein